MVPVDTITGRGGGRRKWDTIDEEKGDRKGLITDQQKRMVEGEMEYEEEGH